MSWPDAEQFCNENDGHLASVTNLKIQNYIQSKVEKNDSNTFFWIGGTDRENEGKWVWIEFAVGFVFVKRIENGDFVFGCVYVVKEVRI